MFLGSTYLSLSRVVVVVLIAITFALAEGETVDATGVIFNSNALRRACAECRQLSRPPSVRGVSRRAPPPPPAGILRTTETPTPQDRHPAFYHPVHLPLSLLPTPLLPVARAGVPFPESTIVFSSRR